MEYAKGARSVYIVSAAAAALVTLSFSLLYWNRFLAPSSGATSFYAAERILRGEAPYRDFLFLTPPLHALKIAALIRVFGDRLAVPRLEAMVERSILAVILFAWLARCCRISAAFVGTVTAMVVYAGDIADSLANYHHDSVFWAVAAGFCANLFLDRARPSMLIASASGVFVGLCFLTKQTTGAGALLVIPVLVGIAGRRLPHARGSFLVPYLLGFVLPIAALVGWLVRAHALQPFWTSVFLNGGSKGSLYTLLTRPFLQMPDKVLPALAAVLFLGILLRRFSGSPRPESARYTVIGIAAALLVVAAGFLTALHPRTPDLLGFFISFHWFVVTLAFLSCGMLFGYLSRNLPGSGFTRIQRRDRWFLAGFSFAIAYALALSWPAYSVMVVPSLALCVALALDRFEACAPHAIYALALLAVCLVTYIHVTDKLASPFAWMFWQEQPVAQAAHRSTLPQLEGLLLSEPTLQLAEKVTSVIRDNTAPGDTLLVYPYFPIFYVLSHRDPPTYSFNHFLDVCPDAVCASDAEIVLRSHPAVIVYMVESIPTLTVLENAYRGGRRSGSRDMVAAIESVTKSYRLLYSFSTPGSVPRRIDVYGRR